MARALDAYLSAYAKAGDFIGVVLVAKGDAVVAQNAYGLAEAGKVRLEDRDRRVRLGREGYRTVKANTRPSPAT